MEFRQTFDYNRRMAQMRDGFLVDGIVSEHQQMQNVELAQAHGFTKPNLATIKKSSLARPPKGTGNKKCRH